MGYDPNLPPDQDYYRDIIDPPELLTMELKVVMDTGAVAYVTVEYYGEEDYFDALVEAVERQGYLQHEIHYWEAGHPAPAYYNTLRNTTKLQTAIFGLKALEKPLGRRIYQFIAERNLKGFKPTTTDIWVMLRNVEQSIISEHIRRLKSIGIILQERHGKYMYHSINVDKVVALKKQMAAL